MKAQAVILALLVLPGVASAAFEPETDLRTHTLDTFTISLNNAPAGNLITRNITWDKPYSYESTSHYIRVSISYTMQVVASQNGIWSLTTANEAAPLDDCAWTVRTINPGTLGGQPQLYPIYGIDCIFRESVKGFPHEHTFYLNRTVQSGTPNAPAHETISLLFETLDVVILSEPTPFQLATNMTAAEFMVLPALAIAGAFLWSRKDPGMSVFGSLLMLAASMWSVGLFANGAGWGGSIALALLFLIAFGYMAARNALDWSARRRAA